MQGEAPGLRTLVVEDEMVIALLVESYLCDLGHEVADLAARLDSGLRLAREGDYDLAILDVNLNGERSFPIAEVLKERGIPVLFATGYGAAGLPSGLEAATVLQKPFTAEELADAIQSAAPAARAAAGNS